MAARAGRADQLVSRLRYQVREGDAVVRLHRPACEVTADTVAAAVEVILQVDSQTDVAPDAVLRDRVGVAVHEVTQPVCVDLDAGIDGRVVTVLEDLVGRADVHPDYVMQANAVVAVVIDDIVRDHALAHAVQLERAAADVDPVFLAVADRVARDRHYGH